ncbi:TPA: iron chelate uptake ABC transporter family permease subunit [Pseudomonas aeruginosa]
MNGLHALRLGSLSLRWRPRAALACLALAGVGLALAAALLGTGSLALGPAEVFASLLGQGQDPTAQRIVQRVRLPRVLTACLVGAALGDASAAQLGVAVERVRLQMVLVAVGMTAIATAAAGPIAFIALAGPQLARRLTRSAGVPLLSGALMGAVLLLAADLLGQRLAYVANLPIGLMTGLLGGFYLLWLLLRSRRI